MLIQGETSVGKTSLIRWLAAATGNQCVRINNHEHTDIQEYIGCYSSDDRGKLMFKEGTAADVKLNRMRQLVENKVVCHGVVRCITLSTAS